MELYDEQSALGLAKRSGEEIARVLIRNIPMKHRYDLTVALLDYLAELQSTDASLLQRTFTIAVLSEITPDTQDQEKLALQRHATCVAGVPLLDNDDSRTV